MARKRRGRGEGGVRYDDKRGRWEASVSLPAAPGKRKRKRVHASTKQGVLDKLDRLRATASAGVIPNAGMITVAQILDRWLVGRAAKTAPRTHEERTRTVEAHLKPRVGNLRLAAMNGLHIEGLYADLARDKVAPSRARHAAGCLVAALNHARKLRLIASNPAEGVPLPAEGKPEMITLTAEQAGLLLAVAKGRPCYPLLALALGSGCRQGEMLGLTWDDLDLDAGLLHVRRALTYTQAAGFELKPPKSAAGKRTVRLPDFALEAMREHRKAQFAAGLIRSPIFCTSSGGFIFRGNVHRALKAVIARTNDPDKDRKGGRPKQGAPKTKPREKPAPVIPPALKFHSLRHTHASLLLSNGQSLRAVAQRLGHANPALTLRVYAHCLPSDDARLSAAIDGLINSPPMNGPPKVHPAGTDPAF